MAQTSYQNAVKDTLTGDKLADFMAEIQRKRQNSSYRKIIPDPSQMFSPMQTEALERSTGHFGNRGSDMKNSAGSLVGVVQLNESPEEDLRKPSALEESKQEDTLDNIRNQSKSGNLIDDSVVQEPEADSDSDFEDDNEDI